MPLISAAARAFLSCEAGERSFEAVEGKGLCEDRPIVPAGSRLPDETTCRNEKRDRARGESFRNGIARQARFEIDIDDCRLESLPFDLAECRSDISGVANDFMPQRVERVLEHHGYERIILDDQNPFAHVIPNVVDQQAT